MAYLNFSPLSGETRAASASDAGRFSPTELRVIDFAQRIDATRELSPQSRFGRFVEHVLGERLPRPLADPRLESLRRFVSLVRHHANEIGDEDVRSFVEAGYSPGQAYGLLAYLRGKAPRTPH